MLDSIEGPFFVKMLNVEAYDMMKEECLFSSCVQDLKLLKRGKVRDVYSLDDQSLLIVACDRISAFDHVLPDPVPGKGAILTQLSNFWFRKTASIVPNHLVFTSSEGTLFSGGSLKKPVEVDDRRVVVRKTKPLAIEAIVRGYITGSGWKEYLRHGSVCGVKLPEGLAESAKLPEPIFTPSTKAETGHDQNISYAEAVDLVGDSVAARVRDASLALYRFAAGYALERGIIIADTKFEFGLMENGEDLLLIDEIFTPDSSRFWPAREYCSGGPQPSFDKQFVRDYLESIKWNKEPPVPRLPEEVILRTQEKYSQAMRLLTA